MHAIGQGPWPRRQDSICIWCFPRYEALYQEVSGEDLEEFFDVWLHTGEKPTTW